MPLDFDALLRSESERFLTVIDAASGDAPVPSCPEWNADDLLWHLGEVQHFWAAVVRGRLSDPGGYVEPDRPADRGALRAFFVDSHSALVEALADAPDAEPAWSWFGPDQTVGFTRRRQVHEALIHRVDAELTAGLEPAIDPELAADGVDEVLTIMFGGAPDWSVVTPEGPIGSARCTDVDRQWLVQIQTFAGTSPNTGNTYTAEPVLAVVDAGTPSFDIAGTASNLDLWLWSRGPASAVRVEGDAAAITALIAEGMQ